MGSLGEQVIAGAQQQAQDLGHTVGDAMNAYHVAATAEHARQELEMQKQDQDMNKAKWFSSQLDQLNRMPEGSMRDASIKSFTTQAKSLYPGMNLDLQETLHKDPEMLQKMNGVAADYANGVVKDPGQLQQFVSQASPDLMAALEKHAQNQAMVRAAQFKSEAMNLRGLTMQDNAVQAAGDKFDKDPNLNKLLPMGQSLGRDLRTLAGNSPEHPVTYQTLHESLMNVANVLGSGSLSDSRVNSITPHVSDELKAKIEQFAASNPNIAADPQYVKYVQNLVNRLHGAVRADVSDRSDQIAAGRENAGLFHTPGIGQIVQSKHQYYSQGQWMQNQASAAAAPVPQAPPANPTPYGATPKEIEANYQAFKAQQAHQTAGGQ